MAGRGFGLWAAFAFVFPLGCAQASGDVSGGEPIYDSSVPTSPNGEDTGASSTDTGSTGTSEGGPMEAAAPTTWTELYASYFGPSGVASCAGNGTCHGDMSQLGYMSSGFLCPNDQTQCYSGFVGPSAGLLVPPGAFDGMYIYKVLRKTVGTNLGTPMPKSPPYAFTPADLDKLQSWITAGAMNN
jgi:hypothetical protein